MELGLRKLGPAHADIASYQTNLGVVLMERGDLKAADRESQAPRLTPQPTLIV